jgi:hypothetical protein
MQGDAVLPFGDHARVHYYVHFSKLCRVVYACKNVWAVSTRVM